MSGDLVKPASLTPLESWAWDNGSESVRRRIAWAKGLERQSKEKRAAWEAGGVWEGPGPEPPEWARGWSATAGRAEEQTRRIEAARITPAEVEAVARAGDWQAARKLLERHKGLMDSPDASAEREHWRRELSECARPCYVRFGEPPPDGRSRNHFDGTCEAGLSVFPAYETPDGRYVLDPGEDGDLVVTLLFLMVLGAPPYLAVGREVGVGGSSEPLLADFTLEPIPRDSVESLWEFPWMIRAGAWLGMAFEALGGKPP